MNFSIPSSHISDIKDYVSSQAKNYLIIASSPYEADMLTKELSFFTKHDVKYFPDRENNHYNKNGYKRIAQEIINKIY